MLNLYQTNNLKIISQIIKEYIQLKIKEKDTQENQFSAFQSIFKDKTIIACNNRVIASWLENDLVQQLGYSPNLEFVDIDTIMFRLGFALNKDNPALFHQSYFDSYGTLLWGIFKLIINLKDGTDDDNHIFDHETSTTTLSPTSFKVIYQLIKDDDQQLNCFKLAKIIEQQLQTIQSNNPSLLLTLASGNESEINKFLLKNLKNKFDNTEIPIALHTIVDIFRFIWLKLNNNYDINKPLFKGSIGKLESRFNIERTLLDEIERQLIDGQFISQALNSKRLFVIATQDMYYKDLEFLKKINQLQGFNCEVFNLNYCREIYTVKELHLTHISEQVCNKKNSIFSDPLFTQQYLNYQQQLASTKSKEAKQPNTFSSELNDINTLLKNLALANFRLQENIAYLLPAQQTNLTAIENLISHPQHHVIFAETKSKQPSLLQQLQQNILHAEVLTPTHISTKSDKLFKWRDDDQSIQIFSHYSTKGELQGLRDHLLHLLNDNSKIKLQDILVLIPDIDQHSKTIYQVFSQYAINEFTTNSEISNGADLTDKDDKRYIPFNICSTHKIFNPELSYAQQIITDLLLIDPQHYLLTDFINLINNPLIQQRFAFSFRDIDLIQRLLQDFNLSHVVLDDPMLSKSTKTLESFLDSLNNNQIFAPEFNLQTPSLVDLYLNQDLSLINSLSKLLRIIIDWCNLINKLNIEQKGLPIHQWIIILHDLTNQLLISKEDNHNLQNQLQKVFKNLSTVMTHSGLLLPQSPKDELAISRYIIANHFAELITQNQEMVNLNPWKLNFVDAYYGSSIPAKYTYLLGLDSNFIKQDKENPELDLYYYLNNPYIISPREKKMSSLLSILINTKERLVISYIGKKISNNEDLSPSFALENLIDYLSNYTLINLNQLTNKSLLWGFNKSQLISRLIKQATLNPYDQDNFSPDSGKLQSYSTEWALDEYHPPIIDNNLLSGLSKRLSKLLEQQSIELPPVINLKLDSLLDFYSNPLKYFDQHNFFGKKYQDNRITSKISKLTELGKKQRNSLMKEVITKDLFAAIDDKEEFKKIIIAYYQQKFGLDSQQLNDYFTNNAEVWLSIKRFYQHLLPATRRRLSVQLPLNVGKQHITINLYGEIPLCFDPQQQTYSLCQLSVEEGKNTINFTQYYKLYLWQLFLQLAKNEIKITSVSYINVNFNFNQQANLNFNYLTEFNCVQLPIINSNNQSIQQQLQQLVSNYLYLKDSYCLIRTRALNLYTSKKSKNFFHLDRINLLINKLETIFTNFTSINKLESQLLTLLEKDSDLNEFISLLLTDEVKIKDIDIFDSFNLVIDRPNNQLKALLLILFWIIYHRPSNSSNHNLNLSYLNWLSQLTINSN